MRTLAILALLVLGACSCPTEIQLDSKWRPLLYIKQSSTTPVGVYQTRGDTCYTGDCCDFLSRSAAEQDGLLIHESMHSNHQLAYPDGVNAFLVQYKTYGAFMAKEEGNAWKAELVWDIQHGVAVDPFVVAKQMSTLYIAGPESVTPGLNVFGYDETLKWVQGLMATGGK